MTINEILEMPQTKDMVHESCFRSYHILAKVMEMIRRDDTKETIEEVADFLRNYISAESKMEGRGKK